jgi:cation-transporting ATPase G
MGDACCADDKKRLEPGEHFADGSDDGPTRFWQIREAQLSAIAGALLLAGLIVASAGAEGPSIALFLGALLIGGWTFVPETLQDLLHGELGVGTLMTIAAVGAVILGEYGEAASLAFLFSISEALEGYAMARTRRGLRALMALVPERVTVRRGGQEAEIDPAGLEVGDVMIVGPGARLATDGIVRRGRSTLNLSAITGESVPVEIDPGAEVFAAAINGGGVVEVEATARTGDSSLARVVHIVEEAQERKGQSQRLVERVARPLVPAIMVVAAGVAVVGSIAGDPQVWIERALVVLVAAAPCALAISVPVTVVAAVGAAAKMGALVKGGAALEALGSVRVMAFDKTGTLTRSRPEVIDVTAAAGADRDTVLRVAAALEARSEHPLAAPILAAAPAAAPDASDVQAHTGRGLVGIVDGAPARLGKPGFIDSGALDATVEALEAQGCSVVLVEHAGRLLGAIAVRDELRPEAAEVIAALRHLGIRRIAMLTGDNQSTAAAIGRRAGVDEVHAELLPEGKVQIVEQLRRQGHLAMVGDGINDAPALATADLGIAMGAMGSDAAIETADVALMGESLTHLPDVLAHARRAGRIMRQNLVLSALIIGVLIPLATLGVLGLAAVVATHELAEIVVIANGVRAGRRGTKAQIPPPHPTGRSQTADARSTA